jgi:hypothetical protein
MGARRQGGLRGVGGAMAAALALLGAPACSELEQALRDLGGDSDDAGADGFRDDPDGFDPDAARDAASDRGESDGDAAADDAPGDAVADAPRDLQSDGDAPVDGDAAEDASDAGLPDLVDLDAGFGDLDAGGEGAGTWSDPIRIRSLPYSDSRDTRDGRRVVDRYGCAAATDESGPELVYRIDVPASGLVRARLEGVEGGADPDVHLLLGTDAADGCLARGHNELSYFVAPGEGAPGSLYVAVDTWVNGAGTELPGAYTLVVERVPLPVGDCAMRSESISLVNRDEPLALPAFGPVVMEAHLVTVADDFDGGWPSSARDGLAAHYALSEAATGFEVTRGEPWAPEGEGDEAWYVNMYWRTRPARGTRMLVFNPANGRAVVASAGWETGPSDPTRIGGVVEEVHLYLGTRHLSQLVMGFTVDQELDLGPIDCD